MFPFAVLLSLALSTPILLTSAICDVSKIKLPPLPSPLTLPPTTLKLSYVAIGVGTQNYTCGSTGTYTNVGALAELFDTSCIARDTALLDAIPEIAVTAWEDAPANLTIAELIAALHMFKNPEIFAQHYFVPGPTGNLDPKWDATSQGALAGNPNAYEIATKVSQAVAPGPTGSQNVDWLSLNGIAGQLAQQVYRTNTQLGQPPANCTPGSAEIEVKYAAMYYFFGSMLQK